MGKLQHFQSAHTCLLEPEHLVGRASGSSLLLQQSYVSAQHALLRWNGSAWEIIDRGSRNGTQLDGAPIEPGQPQILHVGARIAFGHKDELWIFTDAAEPNVFVVDAEATSYLLGSDGVIGVPSNEAPECTAYRDADGVWKLELVDQMPVVLRNGSTFDAAGRSWRFCCPEPVRSTEAADQGSLREPLSLHFSVSSDEEFVELTVECPRGRIGLGSRSHNYLLLTLARARLADRAANCSEGACGWMDKEQLARGLRVQLSQVDLEVFRIRKHFADHGIEHSALVIERRPRTRQLRLGISSLRITRA